MFHKTLSTLLFSIALSIGFLFLPTSAQADAYLWYGCSYVDLQTCGERLQVRGHWQGDRGEVGARAEQRFLEQQGGRCNAICDHGRFDGCQYRQRDNRDCPANSGQLNFVAPVESNYEQESPLLSAQLQGINCLVGRTARATQVCAEAPDPPPTPEECERIKTQNFHDDCDHLDRDRDAEEFNGCVQRQYQQCLLKCSGCTPQAVEPTRSVPENYNGPIPDCAFSYRGCRDINDVLSLIINVGQLIFGIIGSLAFVMVVYGGFVMVTAAGSAERFKKGVGILIAAVIGVLIALSAYLIIDLLLEGLNVSDRFRGIN